MTELRDPAKVLKMAGSSPVAVLNRNKVVGYFVPADAVDGITVRHADKDEVMAILAERKQYLAEGLEYLKDK